MSSKKEVSEAAVVEFTAHILTKTELTLIPGEIDQLALPDQETS